MRRTASALVVLAVSLVLWVTPASASPVHGRPGHPPGPELTGTFSGTSTYEFSQDPTCTFVLEQYTGTYDPDRRGVPGGTYTLDVCITLGDPRGLGVFGRFEVSGRHGFILSGTVDGFLDSSVVPSAFELNVTLTVTDSQAPGRPIRGTITAVGIRTEPGGFGTSVESGTFTADLHRVRGR
jgi:hypothetical protein